MVDALDPHDRLFAGVRGVIAHELAERAFLAGFVRQQYAFDHHFGMGRDRQAVNLAPDHRDRAPAQTARIGELVGADVDFLMGGEEQKRVLAAADQHRAGFAAVEIFLADETPVLARRHPDRDRVRVMHHHPVGGAVDPAGIGVPHDDQVFGADIAPAIVLMHPGNREFEHVDVVAPQHVLENRPGLDLDRGDHFELLAHADAIGVDEVELVARLVEAQHHGEPAERVGAAGHDAEAFGIAGDVVEQDGRRAARLGGRRGLGDRADLEFPVRALDALDLAHLLEDRDQLAQVFIAPVRAHR